MRIVVLDGFCLNPGDINWGEIAALADRMVIYDRTPPALVAERASNYEIILTNKTVIDKEAIDSLPKLKYIGVLATGYNVVNCEYAKKKGIIVTNIPAYSTESVVQAVFGLIIELASGIGIHDRSVHNGEWAACPDFCYRKKTTFELAGKTLGIVGMGRIGKRIKDVASAFGMKVIANNKNLSGAGEGFTYVPLDTLFRESDIISLNCPQTAENTGMINSAAIELMKPSAVIINAARGGLIVEKDLAAALNEGRLAGAGLDVLSKEPPEPDNPLLSAKNCVITPHTAWATSDARARLMTTAAANISAFIKGEPVNVVNK